MRILRPIALPLLVFFPFACSLPQLHAQESSSRVQPQALEALKRMSGTLGAAKAITYRSRNIVEVPARNGQFITLFSNVEVALKRPDKLRARLGGEAPRFDFYFDGKTAAAVASTHKVYSLTKAPPTIDTMLPELEQETGIRFVSAPLLFSNPYGVLTRKLISGFVVGSGTVNGVLCQHLAFRSVGVNWEIWIESGRRALPWRLAVTFTDRTNFPRVLVEFVSWNLNPWLNASDFAFRKPAGASEIPFLSVVRPNVR